MFKLIAALSAVGIFAYPFVIAGVETINGVTAKLNALPF